MSVTDMSEEFIVCCDKVGLIDSQKSKIERLFGTRVYFNEVSRDGDKQKRWVTVTGGKWDRINAKTYILGLSDPEETKLVSCSADFLDDVVLEDIEKNTQAVLTKPSPNSVKISGNELAVTLALSALEELTGITEEIITDSASDADAEKTRERSASQRLDEKLHETFGDESEALRNYPADVKRVLLECGKYQSDIEDISDHQLHGLGTEVANKQNSRKTSSEVIVRAKEEKDPRKHYTAPVCRVNLPEVTVSDGVGVVGADGGSDGRNSEGVSTVTDKFPSAAQISPVKQQTGRMGRGANEDSLRSFAKNVGYTDEDVDEAFQFVQPPMKPTEFLEVLKNLKENKHKFGLEDNSANVDKSDRQKTAGKSDSIIVHSDDDEIMIVEEHFKNPIDKKKDLSPKNKQGGLSKKEKKKNEQKQKDLAIEFQKQQSAGGKKKQPSPQNVNTSGTKRKSDPDSDHEQTCVMKVWEAASDLPDRVPPLPPRQQRIVGPTPAVSDAYHAPPPVPRPHNPSPLHQVVANPTNNVPRASPGQRNDLRYIIIDGSNVAMFHGNNKVFSCKGIQIAVDYFLDRGHKVTVFIPEWRKYRNYHDNKIRDQDILFKLEESEHLVFTPSRKIQGKLVASYDDRFILTLAEKEDSIILSNDQYRDLMREKVSWKKIVEERLLMYRFVGDHFMPAEDPLGRNGPMLDDFLRKNPLTSPPVPDRVPFQEQKIGLWQQPVMANIPHQPRPVIGYWQTDGQTPLQFVNQGYPNGGLAPQMRGNIPWQLGNQGYHNGGQGQWQPPANQPRPPHPNPPKMDLPKRHCDVTEQLLKQLKSVFPESSQEEKLKRVLENHSSETDLNRLTNYCMEVIFE